MVISVSEFLKKLERVDIPMIMVEEVSNPKFSIDVKIFF